MIFIILLTKLKKYIQTMADFKNIVLSSLAVLGISGTVYYFKNMKKHEVTSKKI